MKTSNDPDSGRQPPSAATLAALHRAHVEELGRRYEPLFARFALDALVVHAGTPQKKTRYDDQYWPLRPNPHFQHWLALEEAGALLVLKPGAKPALWRSTAFDFWDAPARVDRAMLEPFEVHEVGGPLPHATIGGGLGRALYLGEDDGVAAALGLPRADADADLLAAVDALRVRKTPYEIACLREANRRACLGHAAVREQFASSDFSELELHLAYLRATGQDDAETPYKNIVALGEAGATLHYVRYDHGRRAQPTDSLLVDAGACFRGYCSDITRTYARGSGALAETFRGLIDGVDALQRALVDGARAGRGYEGLHDESHVRLADVVVRAGIFLGSAEEAVSSGFTRALLPHGLGHALGLQCHDVGCATVKPRPDNPFLRNTSVIEADQCFTIEPGFYVIPPLLARFRADAGFAPRVDWRLLDGLGAFGGIRVEDDLVVGADGACENLTRAFLA
jgi:Xaa-Pro dipeptidase